MHRVVGRWSAARALEALVWALVLAVALGVPLLFFAVERQAQRATLASVGAARSLALNERIAANPQMWRFEEPRLAEFVGLSLVAGDTGDRRAVVDLEGRVIVENRQVDTLRAPLTVHRVPLSDSGRTVAWLELQRSQRDLVDKALGLAGASALLSALVLGFLKWLPLRALRRAEVELERRAWHDDLTGLLNREAFRRALDTAVQRAARQRGRLAVLFIDLDRFKSINDTLGHDAGDAVLRSVADRLRSGVRDCDVVARLSGDEFAIVIDDLTGPDDATRTADSLLARFELPFGAGDRDWHLSCSIGLAMFPQHAREPDKLLAFADTAMLHAKSAGRSSRRMYSDEMLESVARRVTIEDDLRGALDRREFALHYQPLVDLGSGQVRGAEALLRWQHPQRGLVLPVDFIPVLEDLGMIHAVGQWVLLEACLQMRHWIDLGHAVQNVSVNVSALQFARGMEFIDQVRVALAESRLPPQRLQLELTEGVLMSDSERSLELLGELERLGVSLAIDDFGTGYSSLAYLRRFPVAVLKVDRSFVRDMCIDAKDASIVKAVVQMAHSLGLKVTAEGIESAEQLAALRRLGCDIGQGYFLGRPVPADQFQGVRVDPAAEAVGA